MLAVLLSSLARGASLDLLEVGGAYGTPGATNPTAVWWNPAGLTLGRAKYDLFVEAAPTFGGITVTRDNPDYGQLNPDFAAQGFPTEYDYSGTERLSFTGVVPFVGFAARPVRNVGLGLALVVPSGRGGASDQEWGASRYAIRDGSIQHIELVAGGAYRLKDLVSFGASARVVNSRWYADSDYSTYVDLLHGVEDASGQRPETFQDGLIEDRAYSSTLILGGVDEDGRTGRLTDTGLTFGAGVYLTPVKQLGVSVAWDHGVRLNNTGDLTMRFECPPEYDEPAYAASVDQDLCDRTVQGEASIGYRLPNRLHTGVVWMPVERVRVEAMGGVVFWSAFDDYEITTTVLPDQFPNVPSPFALKSSQLLTQDRLWARDGQDSFWLGLDAKAQVHERLLIGARLTFDRHAIPDASVSANNIDNDDVTTGLLAAFDVSDAVGIGLSYSHHFLATRTVTDSAFGLTIEDAAANEDRYFYPSANGTYAGSIDRLGLSLRFLFGGGSPE
ncbi:MAG: outer membrane protein transport protein [Myxococcota bacterium]